MFVDRGFFLILSWYIKNSNNWIHFFDLSTQVSSNRTSNCLLVFAVLISTRRATRPDTLLWSTQISIPLRGWHWTGFSTTSTGPIRVTEPSLWLQQMAEGDVCWSTQIWANHRPSLWIQREGEQISDWSRSNTATLKDKTTKGQTAFKGHWNDKRSYWVLQRKCYWILTNP